MNTGAQLATGDILYFVHADVTIHPDYIQDILTSVNDGYGAGCYRYRFDSDKTLLKINAYFTRFPAIWCRGGDQTLFVTTKIFRQIGGYDDGMVIMEDYDIIKRVKRKHYFRIVPKDITVSARKYDTNSYLRVQFANFFVFSMYFWGVSQGKLVKAYSKILKYR